jgi:curved DNA-binding protein CbpA
MQPTELIVTNRIATGTTFAVLASDMTQNVFITSKLALDASLRPGQKILAQIVPNMSQPEKTPWLAISLEDAVRGTAVTLSVTPPGKETRRLKVAIPPGVDTGSKIRVGGEGDPGVAGGRAGDLYVVVQLQPHPRFTRDGDDVTIDQPVPIFDAVLGGEVTVQTLEGDVSLKIPAGTQGGQVFRLKGKGMPALKGGGRGSLLVRLSLQAPAAPSESELALWRQLAGR